MTTHGQDRSTVILLLFCYNNQGAIWWLKSITLRHVAPQFLMEISANAGGAVAWLKLRLSSERERNSILLEGLIVYCGRGLCKGSKWCHSRLLIVLDVLQCMPNVFSLSNFHRSNHTHRPYPKDNTPPFISISFQFYRLVVIPASVFNIGFVSIPSGTHR